MSSLSSDHSALRLAFQSLRDAGATLRREARSAPHGHFTALILSPLKGLCLEPLKEHQRSSIQVVQVDLVL